MIKAKPSVTKLVIESEYMEEEDLWVCTITDPNTEIYYVGCQESELDAWVEAVEVYLDNK